MRWGKWRVDAEILICELLKGVAEAIEHCTGKERSRTTTTAITYARGIDDCLPRPETPYIGPQLDAQFEGRLIRFWAKRSTSAA
jgi:hypothetical protein